MPVHLSHQKLNQNIFLNFNLSLENLRSLWMGPGNLELNKFMSDTWNNVQSTAVSLVIMFSEIRPVLVKCARLQSDKQISNFVA